VTTNEGHIELKSVCIDENVKLKGKLNGDVLGG
jgi:hypothetical protein